MFITYRNPDVCLPPEKTSESDLLMEIKVAVINHEKGNMQPADPLQTFDDIPKYPQSHKYSEESDLIKKHSVNHKERPEVISSEQRKG